MAPLQQIIVTALVCANCLWPLRAVVGLVNLYGSKGSKNNPFTELPRNRSFLGAASKCQPRSN
jgi:hypothetical protein